MNKFQFGEYEDSPQRVMDVMRVILASVHSGIVTTKEITAQVLAEIPACRKEKKFDIGPELTHLSRMYYIRKIKGVWVPVEKIHRIKMEYLQQERRATDRIAKRQKQNRQDREYTPKKRKKK